MIPMFMINMDISIVYRNRIYIIYKERERERERNFKKLAHTFMQAGYPTSAEWAGRKGQC